MPQKRGRDQDGRRFPPAIVRTAKTLEAGARVTLGPSEERTFDLTVVTIGR